MIHDMNTKNESFLKVHKTLLTKGVHNNKFMLTLLDEKLQGVDPYDKKLTDKMKARIIIECASNFWYFVREVVRWNDGDKLIPTILDVGNSAMYWAALNGISNWRTNVRCSCSDLSVETLLMWNLITVTGGSNKIISRSSLEAMDQLSRVGDLYKSLPEYMIGPGLKIMKESIRDINTELRSVHTPKDSGDASVSLVGDSSKIIFFHEAELISGIESLIERRMPIISSTGNDGKRRLNIFNSPYGVSGEASTIFAENYIEGMVKWKDSFYDYKPHVLLQALYEFGNGVVYIKHNYLLRVGYRRKND